MAARARLVTAAEGDVEFQQWLMCQSAADVFFWMDHFAVQVNPRHVGREPGPFIAYDFQREAVAKTRAWLGAGEDVLWEKSRYQGATWLALLMQIHQCLFVSYKKFLNISHTAGAVDATDDPDSLFWKVRFVLDHLPDWMRRGAERQRTGLVKYPATKSSMTGAATTERAGVGGRATWVLLDEFAKQKDDFAILGQTADTGPRHFVSTHYGLGTAWHHLTERPDIKKVVLHWSQHPEMNPGLYRSNGDGTWAVLDKSFEFPEDYKFVGDGNPTGGPYPGIRSPWYDRECLRRSNPRDVAMHLDISPKGSVSQYFSPQLIYRLRQRAWLHLWEGDLVYDPDSGEPISLVERVGGPLRLWLNPTVDGKVPAARYVFGADISHGLGATPSCISMFRARTGEKIGEYVDAHISAERLGAKAVALCRLFSDGETGAQFIWERQGPGEIFTKRVIELGYRNIYMRTNEESLVAKQSDTPGWYPNGPAKKLLFDLYIAGLTDGSCTNPSDRSLEQCLDFRYDQQGNPEHPGEKNREDLSAGGVNHGDIVTADALAWKVAKELGARVAKQEKEDVPVGSFQWRRELRKQTAKMQEAAY